MRARCFYLLMLCGLVSVALGQLDNIAVVGGGIAGVTTALEVLRQHPTSTVHIFEHSASLSLSTSALIAASISFDEPDQFWGEVDTDFLESIRRILPEGATLADVADALEFKAQRQFEIKRGRDERLTSEYSAKFFNASLNAFRDLFVTNYPTEVCASMFGQWCCDSAPNAAIMEANGGNCSQTLGLYHVIETQSICDAIDPVEAADLGYEILEGNTTILATLPDYLVGEDPRCAIVDPNRSGFARGETLFPLLLSKFIAEPNVVPVLPCTVASMTPENGGEQVTLLVTGTGCSAATTLTFDRVIVTGGAASKTLVESFDRHIDWQILAMSGYILTGSSLDDPDTPTVSGEQLSVGIQIEDNAQNLEAAFVRSMSSGHIRIAGGAEIGVRDSELLPPHPFTSSDEATRIFSATNVSVELLAAPNTEQTAGIRPVSYLGNMPLIKQYAGQWRNVLMNSGFGFHGYVLSWKSAELTVDLLDDRDIDDPDFFDAFTLELSSEGNSTCEKYANEPRGSTWRFGIGAAIGGGGGLLVIMIYYCLSCCLRCACLSKMRDWIAYHRSLGVLIAVLMLVLFSVSVGLGLDYGYTRTCEFSECGPDQTCQYGRCLCNEGFCYNEIEDKCLAAESEMYKDPFDPQNVGDVVFVAGFAVSVIIIIIYLKRTKVDNLGEWRERDKKAKSHKRKPEPIAHIL